MVDWSFRGLLLCRVGFPGPPCLLARSNVTVIVRVHEPQADERIMVAEVDVVFPDLLQRLFTKSGG